jgi:hypothetical protein
LKDEPVDAAAMIYQVERLKGQARAAPYLASLARMQVRHTTMRVVVQRIGLAMPFTP